MTKKLNMSSSKAEREPIKMQKHFVTVEGEITYEESRVDKRAQYGKRLDRTTDPEEFNRFEIYYDTVFVNDFNDRYHELPATEEEDEDLAYWEKEARGIRRRYRDPNEYYNAVYVYNKYIDALENKHGQSLFVLQGLERCGMLADFIPPEPKIKNTKFLKSIVNSGIVLSNPKRTHETPDIKAIQMMYYSRYQKQFPDEVIVGHPYWEQFDIGQVDYGIDVDYTPEIDYSGRVGIQSPFEEAKVKDKYGNIVYDPHAGSTTIDDYVPKEMGKELVENVIKRKRKYSSDTIELTKLYDARRTIETDLFDISKGSIDINDRKASKKFRKKFNKEIDRMNRHKMKSLGESPRVNMRYLMSDEFWEDPDIYKTDEEIMLEKEMVDDTYRFVAGHFIDNTTSENIDLINHMADWGWDPYQVMRMRGIHKEVARELTGKETKKERKAREHTQKVWSKYIDVDYGEEWTNDKVMSNLARFADFDGDPKDFVIE